MKGVVYKLRCLDETIKDIYVGSSMNINHRIDRHKTACNNPNVKGYNYKVYKFIRSNGGYDAWTYDILEECEVENKKDLVLNYERKYILELDPQLNMRVEGRTHQEWYADNPDYNKEYRIKNLEKISNQQKEKFQCECGSEIQRGNNPRHKKTKKHLQFTLGN